MRIHAKRIIKAKNTDWFFNRVGEIVEYYKFLRGQAPWAFPQRAWGSR